MACAPESRYAQPRPRRSCQRQTLQSVLILSVIPFKPLPHLKANSREVTFTATALLFARTVFRAVELSGGFTGTLANNETKFMVLDGVMVILACLCLTAWHPGLGFAGRWKEAEFPFFTSKGQQDREAKPNSRIDIVERAAPAIPK